jgi:hypothetical protein
VDLTVPQLSSVVTSRCLARMWQPLRSMRTSPVEVATAAREIRQ